MKETSTSPSVMITFIMALSSATSVPLLCRMWRWLNWAIWVRRGSATMIMAPRSRASSMCIPIMGCCSVVFDPITKMTRASLISSIEFVMAPEPNAADRPPTVEECQSRAQ